MFSRSLADDKAGEAMDTAEANSAFSIDSAVPTGLALAVLVAALSEPDPLLAGARLVAEPAAAGEAVADCCLASWKNGDSPVLMAAASSLGVACASALLRAKLARIACCTISSSERIARGCAEPRPTLEAARDSRPARPNLSSVAVVSPLAPPAAVADATAAVAAACQDAASVE